MTRPLHPTSGNAFIYVLIAVVLLGGLTFALSRNQDSNPSGTISDGASKAAAMQILAYEATVKTAIDNMLQTGVTVDQINFMLPSNAAFNTAPHTYKLFHPDGGGLQYKTLPTAAKQTGNILPPGQNYYIGRFNNFEWTPTTAQDVIFTAWGISLKTCQALNTVMYGPISVGNWGDGRKWFIDSAVSGIANANFMASDFASANGKTAYCQNNGSNTFNYFSILVSR